MSRHRNFRNIDLDEERHDDYDDYGNSYEENISLSPTSEEFMFKRSGVAGVAKLHDFVDEESRDDKPIDFVQPEPFGELRTEANGVTPPQITVKSSGSKLTTGFNVPLAKLSPQVKYNLSSPALTNLSVERLKIGGQDSGSRSPGPSRPESPLKHVPSSAKLSQNQPVAQRIKSRPADSKPVLNLVVVGHVDAGKSTLMGHFLYLIGSVNQKTIHKYKQDSQKIGKGSFAYAWVLDEGAEERSRGVTIDVARARFSTPKFDVVLLDAPGHKDFIPNMISGAAQADAAILVVNATTGEFETGFDSGGQTREHTMLIRSLGVSQLIVAVNKLDTVEWSQRRFDDITEKLRAFLKQTGFLSPLFVPCCGLTGENLTTRIASSSHPLCNWYPGPCLLEAIDELKPPEKSVDAPLRFTIGDIFRGPSSANPLLSGKVETGALQVNDKVVLVPSGQTAHVKSVQTDESMDAGVAYAGDQCILALSNVDLANVFIGDVLCHPESQISAVVKFEARVVFFNLARPITKGFPVVVHCYSNQRPATISKLISQINMKSGELVKTRPRCLIKNSSGIVEITAEKAICLELYSQNKELGRVTLRSEGTTIAAGVVTKLITGEPIS